MEPETMEETIAEPGTTETATLELDSTETATVEPETAETATVEPETAETATVEPETAVTYDNSIEPEEAETATMESTTTESATVEPFSTEMNQKNWARWVHVFSKLCAGVDWWCQWRRWGCTVHYSGIENPVYIDGSWSSSSPWSRSAFIHTWSAMSKLSPTVTFCFGWLFFDRRCYITMA